MALTKLKLASIVVVMVAAGAVATPGMAGQVSINLAPANASQQHMMQAGLGIYALVNGIQNGSISQNGLNNVAGLMQGGGNNLGVVHQDGNGHNGSLNQQNGNNSYGLFQFGNGTNAHVNQYGGQTGLGFVFGW